MGARVATRAIPRSRFSSVTGRVLPTTREDALSSGADHVMSKPFDPDELEVAVSRLLAA